MDDPPAFSPPMNTADEAGAERFVTQVMDVQRPLYAFILGLVHSLSEADDVLQEVNLVLWRKRAEYQPDGAAGSFQAWAFRVAQWQALAWRKRQSRERMQFDDELVAKLAEANQRQCEQWGGRREALGRCLTKLPADDQALLRHRYTEGLAAKEVARQRGLSADQVYYALHRIHAALAACVRRTLAAEERGA